MPVLAQFAAALACLSCQNHVGSNQRLHLECIDSASDNFHFVLLLNQKLVPMFLFLSNYINAMTSMSIFCLFLAYHDVFMESLSQIFSSKSTPYRLC